MPRPKKPFEFSPEERAVWRAMPRLTLCPKYRRVGFDKVLAPIKNGNCERCRDVYLVIARTEKLIWYLRMSRN
jgi:hypothetical protein